MPTPTPTRRLRVLIVIGYRRWVLDTIARAIAASNPWLEPTVCSANVLEKVVLPELDIASRIDLVHYMSPKEHTDVGARFRDRVPEVSSIHHIDHWEFDKRALDSDALFCVSHQWRDELIARGADPARTCRVSLGIDAGVFSPATPGRRAERRRAFGLADDQLAVGFSAKRTSDVGGRKGVDVFIEAIKRLGRSGRKVAAVIIGPGWSDTARELQSLGIETRMVPFIADYERLTDFYHALDQFWITARIEGGPMTLLEAMSCGVPCVTTPVGLPRQVVKDGVNGCLVPFDDPQAVADRAAALADDGGTAARIAGEARRSIQAEYQWKDTARAVAPLYAAALRRFAHRRGEPEPSELLSRIEPASPPPALEGHNLHAIPPALRRRVWLDEELLWSRVLQRMGEPGAAMRAALRAAKRYPLNRHAWAQALRAGREALR